MASFDQLQSELGSLEADIQAAETEIQQKDALKRLLTRFPLLFGYWSKLVRLDPTFWRQALESAPCVQLWTEYLDSEGKDQTGDAVQKIGRDFASDPIWDRHLNALTADPDARIQALRQVVQIPLYQYANYAETARNEISDLDSQILDDTAAGVAERWNYESRIERPYFHVYELGADELAAWDEYLNYEEDQGDPEQIEALYTRCLTATALYPGFWLRYLRWLTIDLDGQAAKIDDTFSKALHYHPNNEKLLLYRAQIYELQSRLDLAGELYKKLGGTYHDDFQRRQNPEAVPASVNKSDEEVLAEFEKWKSGSNYTGNAEKLATRLRDLGYLEQFFAIEATLE